MSENPDNERVPIQGTQEPQSQTGPRIVVIGIGGAGGNAINNMIQGNLAGVEFLVANTDAQAIGQSRCERCIQIGRDLTQGLGAGSRPEVGRAAAEEGLDEILQAIGGAHMVFITAGMGGGTGTGAAPVIARGAREAGILTVGVVTKPFEFEGVHRMRLAEAGIAELTQYVDTLIVIPNQNLFGVADEKTTFIEAFKMADAVLNSGVRGVTDLMVLPGLINLDFADIRSVMTEMGQAIMGTGEAEGNSRAIEAAEAAISNPLLDEVSMKGARGVLINITGALDMTLFEVDQAANRIRDEVDPEANIIFGSTFNQELEGRIRVSVVATGIGATGIGTTGVGATGAGASRDQRPKPPLSLVVNAPGVDRADKGPASRDLAPEIIVAASKIAADSQTETVAKTGGAFDSGAPEKAQKDPWWKPAIRQEQPAIERETAALGQDMEPSETAPWSEVPATEVSPDPDPAEEIPDSEDLSKGIADDETSSSQRDLKEIEASLPGLEEAALERSSLPPAPEPIGSWGPDGTWRPAPSVTTLDSGGPTPIPALPDASADLRELESESDPSSLAAAPLAATPFPEPFEDPIDLKPEPAPEAVTTTLSVPEPDPGFAGGLSVSPEPDIVETLPDIDSGPGFPAPSEPSTLARSPDIDPIPNFLAPPEAPAVETSPGIGPVPEILPPPEPAAVETTSDFDPIPEFLAPPEPKAFETSPDIDPESESPPRNPVAETESAIPPAPPVGPEASLPASPRKPDGVFSRLSKATTANPEELFEQGEAYYYGQGTARNLALAFRSYRKAAELGHAAAQNRLGWMYEKGEGCAAEYSAAVAWHRKSAEQGNVNAMNDLGYMYRQGWGVEQTYAEALYWFGSAAAKYDSYAEYNMGQMYENGWGVEKDLAEAIRWFRRSAARGHEWAAKRLEELGVAS